MSRHVGQKRKLRTLESDDKEFSITSSCNKRLKLNNGGSHQVHRVILAQTRPVMKVLPTQPKQDDDSKSHDPKEQDYDKVFPMFDYDEEDMQMAQMPCHLLGDNEKENIIARASQGFLGCMEWVDIDSGNSKGVQSVNSACDVIFKSPEFRGSLSIKAISHCHTVANVLFNRRTPVM